MTICLGFANCCRTKCCTRPRDDCWTRLEQMVRQNPRDSPKLTIPSHWTFNDPYMSQEHLHIYVTISQNAKSGCESLVYAEDLSRNGVYWNDSLMGKKNNAFLLSDGDRLRLTSKTTLVYQSINGPNPSHFDLVQEQEMKVSRSFTL